MNEGSIVASTLRDDAARPMTDVSVARFERDGFVHLPNCIDAARVAELRREMIELFSAPSKYAGDVHDAAEIKHVYHDAFNRYDQLAWVPFDPTIVAALRKLLGDDFVYLPEFAIHDSGYGGWHKDTTSQELAGRRFHWDGDFRMVQVALYLQDNDPEYAGGLDVVVGSHERRDRYAEVPKRTRLDRLKRGLVYRATNVRNDLTKQTIRSAAGDVVIFHLRIDHKATTPRRKPVPASHRKLAAFAVASRNDRHARSYLDFIKTRPDYLYLKEYAYAPSFRRRAEAAGVTLLDP